MEVDPYELLAVGRDASPREIDEARRYAHRVLGDISRRLDAGVVAEKTAAIDQAWKVLSDPEARAEVDDRFGASTGTSAGVDAGGLPSGTRPGAHGHLGKTCSVCHAAPAMTMHFRARRSKRLVESVTASFCRTCGIATFRDVTNQTLRQGFWRARSIISTMAIVQGNWRERRRIDALRQSDDTDLSLDPGRSLWLRSGIVAVSITMAVVVLSMVQLADISSLLSTHRTVLNELPLP